MDIGGEVLGTVEVVDTNPPSEQLLAAQESLVFAYYRLLPQKPRKNGREQNSRGAVWLCSPECWIWYARLNGEETSCQWEAPRCDGCNGYFHQDSLSRAAFRSWAYDPYSAYCIHCAANMVSSHADVQWRPPGELAGGDPREWTPSERESDPEILFMAYCDAAFWAMVWKQRDAKLDAPVVYEGNRNEEAEKATARRLPMVMAAFDTGDWARGTDLLLPIGAPRWAAYEDEPERLLAFLPENCRGTAAAWERLLAHRLGQLPDELADSIRLIQAHIPRADDTLEQGKSGSEQRSQEQEQDRAERNRREREERQAEQRAAIQWLNQKLSQRR